MKALDAQVLTEMKETRMEKGIIFFFRDSMVLVIVGRKPAEVCYSSLVL